MKGICITFLLSYLSSSIAFVSNRRPLNIISKDTSCCRSSTLFSSHTDASILATNDSSALEKAQQLRDKAKALRLEANNAEQALRSITQQRVETKRADADSMIDMLLDLEQKSSSTTVNNNNIPTAQTLSLRIKDNRLYSATKLQKIVERLHERETAMIMGPEGYLSKTDASIVDGKGDGGFQIGDENNSIEYKKEEVNRISGLLDNILEAVQLIDDEKLSNLASALRVRVTDLRQSRDALVQRRVNSLANAVGSSTTETLDGLVQNSLNSDKSEDEQRIKEKKFASRLIESPAWLPRQLAAFAATSPDEVSVSTWKSIRTDLLKDSGFECSNWDSSEVAAVYRGRLSRTRNKVDTEEEGKTITTVFAKIQDRLQNHTELKDSVQLFLVEDNEWRPPYETAGNYGSTSNGWDRIDEKEPPPVIIAMAKSVVAEQEEERDTRVKALAMLSTILTLVTTGAYALSGYALNQAVFNAIVNENDVSALPSSCLPIFAGVVAISSLHELGHIIAAKKHDVKLGVPVPLPSLQLGTFGSITPLRSFPRTRSVLFDVSVSGPIISMLVSIILIVGGLGMTITSVGGSLSSLPVVPASMMKSSLFIGSICSFIAPKIMLLPPSQPVPIHPFFLIGFAGLLMTSVNLLPIGVSQYGFVIDSCTFFFS